MGRVLTIQTETVNSGSISRPVKELLIATAAVATVSLAVTDSAFLVFAVCVGLAIAAFLRFEFFVYGLVFLLPWYPLLDASPPFRDVFLLLRFVLLAGVWLRRRREGKSFSEWMVGSKLKRGVLLFAGVAIFSLLVSSEHANIAAYRSLVRLLSYLAVFFAISGWLEDRRQITTIIKVLLVSTIGVALFGLYQVYERGYTDLYFYLYPLQKEALEPWVGRITSFLFHFNSLAGYLNLVLPLSLAWMTFAEGSGMRTGLICHSVAAAALYFTGSRGGLIAYGGTLLTSVWFLKPKRTALFRLCVSLALAAGLIVSLKQPGGDGAGRQVDEFDQQTRLAAWAAARMMFLDHPVLGVGYGNYRSLYNDYIPVARLDELDAHNLYLQFLAETGIIGFLIFCVLMAVFAWNAIKLARHSDPFYRLVGVGVGGALAGTLIHGMVDYLFNASPQFGALFWLVLALGLVAFQDSRKNPEQASRAQAN
jgi:putative inorganic carbon (HCO3(-)) transporter